MTSGIVEKIAFFIAFFIILLIPLGLIFVANLGEKRPWARILTILTVVLLALLLLVSGLFTTAGPWLANLVPEARPAAGTSPLVAVLSGLLMMATAVVALLPLIPFVRRLLAYIIPIRAESIVNGLALALSIMAAGMSIASLPSAAAIADTPPQMLENIITLPLIWLQGLMFVAYGFAGVGFLIRRGFRESLQRLGLGTLTLPRLSIGIAVFIILMIFTLLTDAVWRIFAPTAYREFGRLTESLFGPFISIPGALTLGLSAGIGEEILFRGALQPRLGIFLTSFLFTVVHSQYGLTPALIQIFVVGIVLGLLRRYTNTTTTIIVHALFNATAVLLSLWFPNQP